jgi:hypothetical protein
MDIDDPSDVALEGPSDVAIEDSSDTATEDSSDAALESSAPSLLAPVSLTPAPFPANYAAAPMRVDASGHRYRSPVWDHFVKAPDYKTSEKATCVHCDKMLRASHGSTSTMLHHLQKKHPNSFADSNSLSRSSVFPRRDLLRSLSWAVR